MENTEVCSPVSLVRVLSKAPRKKPIKLIQLKKSDMMDYHSEANRFRFDGVPYTKVKCLRYSADSPMDIEYKVRFSDKEWAKESLQLMVSLRKLNSGNDMEMKTPKQITTKKFLSKEKIKDIESMLPFMPANDRLYMELMCKTTSTSEERAPEASAAKPSKAAAAPKSSKSGEDHLRRRQPSQVRLQRLQNPRNQHWLPHYWQEKRNEAPQFCKFTSVRILCNVNFSKIILQNYKDD